MTWATCVLILVFLDLSVLELFPTYATERQTDVRQTDVRQHRLMPRGGGGAGHNNARVQSGTAGTVWKTLDRITLTCLQELVDHFLM